MVEVSVRGRNEVGAVDKGLAVLADKLGRQ